VALLHVVVATWMRGAVTPSLPAEVRCVALRCVARESLSLKENEKELVLDGLLLLQQQQQLLLLLCSFLIGRSQTNFLGWTWRGLYCIMSRNVFGGFFMNAQSLANFANVISSRDHLNILLALLLLLFYL
jgi:hypothetical protein